MEAEGRRAKELERAESMKEETRSRAANGVGRAERTDYWRRRARSDSRC